MPELGVRHDQCNRTLMLTYIIYVGTAYCNPLRYQAIQQIKRAAPLLESNHSDDD